MSFDFNVAYSSRWGYSLINTLKLKKKENSHFQCVLHRLVPGKCFERLCHRSKLNSMDTYRKPARKPVLEWILYQEHTFTDKTKYTKPAAKPVHATSSGTTLEGKSIELEVLTYWAGCRAYLISLSPFVALCYKPMPAMHGVGLELGEFLVEQPNTSMPVAVSGVRALVPGTSSYLCGRIALGDSVESVDGWVPCLISKMLWFYRFDWCCFYVCNRILSRQVSQKWRNPLISSGGHEWKTRLILQHR